MTIFDKLESFTSEIGLDVHNQFCNGKLDVTKTSEFLDPGCAERYEVSQQNSLRDHERDYLFSVVKYPEWYALWQKVPIYNIEGHLSEHLISVIDYDGWEEDMFNRAKQMCKFSDNTVNKNPKNMVDYVIWYAKHKIDVLNQELGLNFTLEDDK